MKVTYLQELQKQVFLLSAAGLGACFAILYRISRQVMKATYDEHGNYLVVIDVVLGLVSGTILAQLIPINKVGDLGTLTTPMLALLGGFSSSLVFRILTKMGEAVEALFAPDREEQVEVAQQQAQVEVRNAKSTVANDLVRLRAKPPGEVKQELENMIDRLTAAT